jgi:hypothetical protein
VCIFYGGLWRNVKAYGKMKKFGGRQKLEEKEPPDKKSETKK